jgi:hypothetical protein
VDAAGHDDGAAVRNAIDQVEDVAPADLGDLAVPPVIENLALDGALCDVMGSVPSLISAQPFLGDAGEVRCARGRSASWIAAGVYEVAILDPCLVSCLHRHLRIDAKGHASKLAAGVAIEMAPRLAAPGSDTQGKAWERGIEVVDLTFSRRLYPPGHRVGNASVFWHLRAFR